MTWPFAQQGKDLWGVTSVLLTQAHWNRRCICQSKRTPFRPLQAFRRTFSAHIQLFIFDTPATTTGEFVLYNSVSFSRRLRLMHDTTRYLMEPIIEAYAIGFKRLANLIRDLLNALGCLMRHIVEILAFPIYFLAITFYAIVMTLVGVAPRQDFPHYPFTPSSTLYSVDLDNSSNESSNNSDLLSFSQVDGSLTRIPDGCVKSASLGHLRITPPNPPPASPDHLPPPPAIPPHLKDCEFYYKNVVEDLLEIPPLLNDGGQPIVRLTVDGVRQHCIPGFAKSFLQSLETMRPTTVNDAGGFDLGEEKRGKLELRNRVYVGPAQWLVRVLIEEV